MPDLTYDLVVIGGGPAGAVAAALGARHGWKVALVEKQSFPRFRIGESLLPISNAILEEIGVLTKVQSAGFIPKYGARFYSADGSQGKFVDFSSGRIPGLDSSFQVDRAHFDSVLLDHAESLGVVRHQPATAKAVRHTADHVEVDLAGAADKPVSNVRARWLIDASGRDLNFPDPLKLATRQWPWPRRTAVYAHFRGVTRAAGRGAGDTVVVRLNHGWCWLIPIDEERTSVGIVTTVDDFRARGSVEGTFHGNVADSAWLTQALQRAEPLTPFHVTADYSYYRPEVGTDRSLLVGDAAGFYDPIFSSGVYLGMWSAREAFVALAEADAAGGTLSPARRRRYTRALRRHGDVFRKLIDAFYDDRSFQVFMTPQPPLRMGPALTSIVAGHAELTWPLWWRFHLFIGICRLAQWGWLPMETPTPAGSVEVGAGANS